MSIFKRLTSNSGASTGKDAIKSAAKRAERISSEDLTSSIRAELALEFEDIIEDDKDVSLGIDDISEIPEIDVEIQIPEPAETDITETPETFQHDFDDVEDVSIPKPLEPVRNNSKVETTQSPKDANDDQDTPLPVVTFSKEDVTSETDNLAEDREVNIYDGPPAPRRAKINLSELRLDVVRISADIESGEELYRRAQQRVESLMTFVDQAEVTGSLLNKLEPENRRLKARNRSLQSEVISQTQRLETLTIELDEQRKLASKARIKVETLKSQLSDAHEAIRERNTEIETYKSNQNDLQVQSERIKTSLDIETRENITMRERLKDLSEQIEGLNDDKIDALKNAETFKMDFEDQQHANEQLQTEISEVRLELGKTRLENEDMRDELVEIQEKVVQFKSHQELVLLRKDDKIIKMEALIHEFQEKMKLKESVVQSAVTDVSQMRRASTASVVEREKLEKIIESQNSKLQAAEERILLSKKEAESLDRRYRDAAAALLKVQAQAKTQSKDSSENPDIYPTMKEQQITRQKELDEDRDMELERQQVENLERITKVYDRDPDDIRSRYLDDPFVSPNMSESG